MGLSIVVGVIPSLYDGGEEAERQDCRDEFAAMNGALVALGLPAHQEPEQLPTGSAWDCEVGSPVCLHYLRRVAAYLALGKAVPGPATGDPAQDPTVEQYFASCSSLVGNAGQDRPAQLPLSMNVSSPGVAAIEGPGFEHLMWHSDCTGYYLPVPFSRVIVLPDHPRWDWHQWGPWLGSSHTLLRECEQLAEVLQYPRSAHFEELRQQPPDPAATDWRRYAIECFMCQALIAACEASIRSGCAIVFC